MNVLPPTRLTRRAALAAAAGSLAGVAACTPNAANAPAHRRARERAPEPDPDVVLAATVLADEQDLLDRVEATIARHPALEQLLTPARDAHRAHVELLQEAAPDEPLPTGSPSVSPTPDTPDDGEAEPRVPGDRRRAVLALARREEDLSLVDKRSAFAAESGSFARVLASMAASAAQQADQLRVASAGGAA